MDPLIVVSGCLRTGTSMMMRMLYLGGMDIVADSRTLAPHQFNAHGTFEVVDYAWLMCHPNEIAGHAVKIVAPLLDPLGSLLTQMPMKVIFMQRSYKAILKSRKNQGVIKDVPPWIEEKEALDLFHRHNTPLMKVDYGEAIKRPRVIAVKVRNFIQHDLDIDKMVEAVDPKQNHFGK